MMYSGNVVFPTGWFYKCKKQGTRAYTQARVDWIHFLVLRIEVHCEEQVEVCLKPALAKLIQVVRSSVAARLTAIPGLVLLD